MGYYTHHTLAIRGIINEEEFRQVKQALKDKDILGYALSEYSNFAPNEQTQFIGCYEEAKWYEHEEDMINISKQFPNFVFKLHGEGEDNDDVWDQYFYQGHTELCVWSFVANHPVNIPWE